MDHSVDIAATAHFFDRAISEISGLKRSDGIRVLDFGCGSGELVGRMVELGYDAHGCDIVPTPEWRSVASASQRLWQIHPAPYRLPFDDACFDIVVSTSVLEHARNPDEYLRKFSGF
jgi:2-polyprenyl-3-methyl-5-hydroxy-6-metoxy-1,4-benzoquinol methylase